DKDVDEEHGAVPEEDLRVTALRLASLAQGIRLARERPCHERARGARESNGGTSACPTIAVVNCEACHAPVPEASRFCPSCGQRLVDADDGTRSTDPDVTVPPEDETLLMPSTASRIPSSGRPSSSAALDPKTSSGVRTGP